MVMTFIVGTLLVVVPTRTSIILAVDGLRRDIGNPEQPFAGCKMIQTTRFVFAAAGLTLGPHHDAHTHAAVIARQTSSIAEAVDEFERLIIGGLAASLRVLRAENRAVFENTIQNRVLTVVFAGTEEGLVRLAERWYRAGADAQVRRDGERSLVAPFAGVPPRFYGDAASAVSEAEGRLHGATNPVEFARMVLELGTELRPDTVGPPFQFAFITADGTRWAPPDSPGALER